MLFDFQHKTPSGRWSDLGLSELPDDIFDLDLALSGLRIKLGGAVPCGAWRFRIVDGEEHWRYGEMDEQGRFRFSDPLDRD